MGKVCITFVYGNTSVPAKEGSRSWVFFVEARNEDTKKYIEQVEVRLHPTFSPSTITMTKAPFNLKRTGWGTFEIGFKIFWKPNMGGGFTEHTHFLEF